ncbi:MAG: MaoC family dehydratase [Pseudomonadota bacterium]
MTRVVQLSDLKATVGERLGPTGWVEVQQDRIDRFADATDDHQWIHVDPQRAAQGPFGRTIAHGYLSLALVNRFLPELIRVEGASMGVNYGCDTVRFPAPVLVDSRIRGVGEVTDVSAVKNGVQLVVRVTVEVEGQDRPACVVDSISRFFR